MQSRSMGLTFTRQNTKMKERLSSLGFAMAVEPIPNHTQVALDDLDEIGGIAEAYAEDDRRFQKSSSTHTAGRSAHTPGHTFTSSDRPLKRQRVDSPLPRGVHSDPPRSRDMMPPPSKPLSRMCSVRSLFPTIRKKFISSRSSPKEHQQNHGDTQMFDSGQWHDTADLYDQNNQNSTHDVSEQTPQESRLLSDLGKPGNASEFSFRASSPVKLVNGRNEHHPVQMPSGPSYLHLMDGLSYNSGIELGLKDPRKNTSSHYAVEESMPPPLSTPQNQHQYHGTNDQQHWRFGHAFLHQSPNASPRPNAQQHTPSQERPKGVFSRAHYDQPAKTTTLAPQPQQPVRHMHSVVSSPFFGRSPHDVPPPSRPWITKAHPSSHHFAVSRSQRRPPSQTTAEWHKPPSLNGLSFFEAPLDAHNQPILRKSHRQPSRYTSLQTHESGQLPGRDTHHVSSVHNGKHSSSTGFTFSRQHQMQPKSKISPSRASDQAHHLQLRQPPSSMPSVFSSHSSVNRRSQLETLQRAGLRSNQQTFGKAEGNMLNPCFANTSSYVGRRSVRR